MDICGGYNLAYPKANEFMNNADENLQKIINKLTDGEWETLRDRFADFHVTTYDCVYRHNIDADNILNHQ